MRTDTISATALRILGAIFSLRIEVTDVPVGRKLGTINLPGYLKYYINIELRILGFLVLLGYIELV